jgi:O-6-methylguanine DNA methyltransferase
MSDFLNVYKTVKKIPKGKVSTYKSVAKICKINNPRLVGFALHRNKDTKTIPCHRVIKSNGYLPEGYAFGGIKVQEKLLKKEGVIFIKKNLVNLKKSFVEIK